MNTGDEKNIEQCLPRMLVFFTATHNVILSNEYWS